MTINPNLVAVGTINAGATTISADVSAGLSPAAAVPVTLSTPYTLLFPPGWPTRPGYDGTEVKKQVNPIPSGTRFAFLQPEAAAIVNAGAGAYS